MLQLGMAKFPTAVRSIRLPVVMWERIAKNASDAKLTVNAYVRASFKSQGFLREEDDVPTWPEHMRLTEEPKWSATEVAAMKAKPRSELKINRIPPGIGVWPSGAVVLPEHREDPGPSATTRVHVEVPMLERRAHNPQPKTGKK